MQEKIIGKSFEDMQLEDMANIFGGSSENIQPRITPTILASPVTGPATIYTVTTMTLTNKVF